MGASSSHAGYPSDSPPGSPGLGAGLVARFGGHGVRLSLVLGHVTVDEVDQVRADRRLEYTRHGHIPAKGAFGVVHSDQGTRCLHCRTQGHVHGNSQHTDGVPRTLNEHPHQKLCLLVLVGLTISALLPRQRTD